MSNIFDKSRGSYGEVHKNTVFCMELSISVDNSFQQFTSMNKYLWRGLIALLLGIAGVYWGIQLMGEEQGYYKLVLILGVILFGVGFITLLYRVFRTLDRSALLDARKNQKDKPKGG